MKDLLFFENMLTPKIITVVYWLLILGSVVGGMGAAFSSHGGFFGKLFMGLLFSVGGIIASRIWCELLIVIFKINEALQEARNKP